MQCFIPFPIVDEHKDSIYLQFATDNLQAVYDQLKREGIIEKRRVYFIYPSGDLHEYVLRDETGNREYIKCGEVDEGIRVERTLFVD